MEKVMKCSVIMLPTEKSKLYTGVDAKLRFSDNDVTSRIFMRFPQHLYLVSNDEIKKGDWFIYDYIVADVDYIEKSGIIPSRILSHRYNSLDKDYDLSGDKEWIYECKGKVFQKIIATTDTSLGLPGIDDAFIKKYASTQGNINEVYFELEEKCVFDFTARCTQGNCSCNFIPKIETGNVIIRFNRTA